MLGCLFFAKVTAVVKSDTGRAFDGKATVRAGAETPALHGGGLAVSGDDVRHPQQDEGRTSGHPRSRNRHQDGRKPGMVESIELHVSVKAPELSEEQVERVKELTEKYCLIAESIRKGTRIDWVRVAFE